MFYLTKLAQLFTKNPNSMNKYSKEELKKRLSPMQYRVTQENGTEPPYQSTSSCIQTSITRPILLASTTVSSALSLSSLLRPNTIVDVDGLHSMMR